jgi:hypothetical protein
MANRNACRSGPTSGRGAGRTTPHRRRVAAGASGLTTHNPPRAISENTADRQGPQWPWEDRAHFSGIAARLMRQFLIDHTRKRHARKRGIGARTDQSVSTRGSIQRSDFDVLALHDRLNELAVLDPGKRRSSGCAARSGLTEAESPRRSDAVPGHDPSRNRGSGFWLGDAT